MTPQQLLKQSQDPKRTCVRHPDNLAATCDECYDAALRQQNQQLVTVRKAQHAWWLAHRT